MSEYEVKKIKRKLNQLPRSLSLNVALAEAYVVKSNFQEAKKYYLRSIDLSPSSAQLWNSLGILEMKMGHPNEAVEFFEKALALLPNYSEAASNLGVALYGAKRYDESIEILRELVRENPGFVDVTYNLGSIIYEVGDLNEAELYLRKAISINSDLSEAHWSLAHVHRFFHRADDSITEYLVTTKTGNQDRQLGAWLYLGIMYFLKSDVDSCVVCLENAKQIIVVESELLKNIKKYLPYMIKLLLWRQSAGSGILNKFPVNKTVYVIGESHCLAAHDVTVKFGDAFAVCKSIWIEGGKQYHFGQDGENRYKQSLKSSFESIPLRSTILLNFGEIDCRFEEGMLLHIRNHPENNIDSVVIVTATKYLDFISRINYNCGHAIIVAGVPCSNRSKDLLRKEQFELLNGLILKFNTILRGMVHERGYDFIDLYSMTDSGSGSSNGKWHIDDVHLSPAAIVEAFNNYFIPSASG